MILSPSSDDPVETTEINITPFIDVMLVLLIIFMVAAPLSAVDVPVDLPATRAAPTERPDSPVILTLSADGALRLGERGIERADLAAALAGAMAGRAAEPVFVAADRQTRYAALMEVMDLLRAAGHAKIALVGVEAAE